jgi:hypothetical protein
MAIPLSKARLRFCEATFSAPVHNLDHISTACAQSKSFFLLHDLELSGTLRSALLDRGVTIRKFLAES